MPDIDYERQAKAKEYARQRRLLFFGGLALTALLLAALLASNPGPAIVAGVGGPWPYLPVAVYFVLLLLAYEVVTAPLSYYGGYVLPHRFGLSTQTFGDWLRDTVKGGILSLLLGLLAVEVVYFLLANFPVRWWVYAAGFMLIFSVVLANLAPLLILPLFYRLRPLEDRDLVRRLEDLARRAGTRVRGVYTMDLSRRTTAANAALMGIGNTRRIVLGDTLLDNYPPDEIEVVLAHELGHHVHHDVAKGIAVDTALVLLSFWLADQTLRWGAERFGLSGPADPVGLPLLGLAAGMVSLLAMPLSNTFTRLLEAAADRYALEVTDKAEAFRAAMIRLANQNLAEVDPPRWAELLLYDHPPIGKRVAMARAHRHNGG